MKPLLSMCLTMKPISSMCAASMTRRSCLPRFQATTLPRRSTLISSTNGRSSSMTMARTRSSCPAMPGVSANRLSRGMLRAMQTSRKTLWDGHCSGAAPLLGRVRCLLPEAEMGNLLEIITYDEQRRRHPTQAVIWQARPVPVRFAQARRVSESRHPRRSVLLRACLRR